MTLDLRELKKIIWKVCTLLSRCKYLLPSCHVGDAGHKHLTWLPTSSGLHSSIRCVHADSGSNTGQFLQEKRLALRGRGTTQMVFLLWQSNTWQFGAEQSYLGCHEELLQQLPQLIPEEKAALDCELTLEKLTVAVNQMALGLAPGTDSLSNHFFKHFWDIFGLDLHLITLDCFKTRFLPVSGQRELLSLLPMNGDRALLKNWRLVALLCAITRFFSRLLSNRLRNILDLIVQYYQANCVLQRTIISNICFRHIDFGICDGFVSWGGLPNRRKQCLVKKGSGLGRPVSDRVVLDLVSCVELLFNLCYAALIVFHFLFFQILMFMIQDVFRVLGKSFGLCILWPIHSAKKKHELSAKLAIWLTHQNSTQGAGSVDLVLVLKGLLKACFQWNIFIIRWWTIFRTSVAHWLLWGWCFAQ